MIYTFVVPREFRLRMRIDELAERLLRAQEQLAEERDHVSYLSRRVETLTKQRDQWRERAQKNPPEWREKRRLYTRAWREKRAQEKAPPRDKEVLPGG